MKRTLLCTPFLVVLLSAAGAPADAQGDANAVKGLIADRCAGCHLVPGYSAQGLPTVDAPPFQTIADDPQKYSDERIRTFLLKPHWPMTQFALSPRDIDDLVAYFDSLRGQ